MVGMPGVVGDGFDAGDEGEGSRADRIFSWNDEDVGLGKSGEGNEEIEGDLYAPIG
ncbi:MAG: hypothetical protein GY832_37645 [Chloroflexi bacterium]|nr:hypothetical protein [Chloroflexota bacterium]